MIKLFSVLDIPAGAYLPIFPAISINQAKRMFQVSLADEHHRFSDNPQDYELWQIAEFDEMSGEIQPSRDKLINGLDSINQYRREKAIYDKQEVKTDEE